MIVPQRWFNAYRGPRKDDGSLLRGQKVPPNTIMPGDLQLHFAGKKTTKALMPLWVALATDESSGWSKPLKETKLLSEIALFWKLQKEKQEWNSPVERPKKEGKTGEKQSHDTVGRPGAEGKDHKPLDDLELSSLNSPAIEGKSDIVDLGAEEKSSEKGKAEEAAGELE